MHRTPYSGSLSLWLRSRRNLTKRRIAHSSAHSSIGTLSPMQGIGKSKIKTQKSKFLGFGLIFQCPTPAPTPCKHTVSDTISSPSRAAFQLSLTVLVHYRSGGVFSLATSSSLLPTRFLESRSTLDLEQKKTIHFRLPDYHRLWFCFPADSANSHLSFYLSWERCVPSHNTRVKITQVRPRVRC